MQEVLAIVEKAKGVFASQLQELACRGGLTRERYIRYLSFQYHLTKGVQRHFLKVAGHPRLSGKAGLRNFLFKFGLEEEAHYKVAEIDLDRMGEKPLPCPLDVSLWWAYFDQIVEHRPFVRLGATCVLENLGAGAGALGHRLLDEAPFLNKGNTRFLTIHFHELLPHGDQIISALTSAPLEPLDLEELVEGANIGSILYLRMAAWAIQSDPLTCQLFDPTTSIQRSSLGLDPTEETCLVADHTASLRSDIRSDIRKANFFTLIDRGIGETGSILMCPNPFPPRFFFVYPVMAGSEFLTPLGSGRTRRKKERELSSLSQQAGPAAVARSQAASQNLSITPDMPNLPNQ
jgi:hypothetical protein